MNSSVPLTVLLSAAGLKSARSLTDLLTYCPTVNETAAKTALRAITPAPVGGES